MSIFKLKKKKKGKQKKGKIKERKKTHFSAKKQQLRIVCFLLIRLLVFTLFLSKKKLQQFVFILNRTEPCSCL